MKDQKKTKGTTKPLMANFDITHIYNLPGLPCPSPYLHTGSDQIPEVVKEWNKATINRTS